MILSASIIVTVTSRVFGPARSESGSRQQVGAATSSVPPSAGVYWLAWLAQITLPYSQLSCLRGLSTLSEFHCCVFFIAHRMPAAAQGQGHSYAGHWGSSLRKGRWIPKNFFSQCRLCPVVPAPEAFPEKGTCTPCLRSTKSNESLNCLYDCRAT